MREISGTSLQNVMEQFGLTPHTYEARPCGSGHINNTFLVSGRGAKGGEQYILQRINTGVFTNPEGVMENIMGVTEFLRRNTGENSRETLTFFSTTQGKNMARDDEDGCWRMYRFVENSACYDAADSPEIFQSAGAAFGRLMRLLADYPVHTLHETIPRFHDTAKRFADLQNAVREDSVGRVKDVAREIDFFMGRESEYGRLLELFSEGQLPLRVTHNDTKLNNVLFDTMSGKAICVIDLDTVMPGLCLYDFGDAIRYGANTAAEDETDLSKVSLSIELFGAYTSGYLSETAGVLTPLERELLPTGAKLMTMECGMRFLTDYLSGDTYFRIHRPSHNLDRARTQIALAEDMERKWSEMEKICK